MVVFMHSIELSDVEVDVIRHCLKEFKVSANKQLISFAKKGNLDAVRDFTNALSTIEFLLNKIKF